MSADRTLYYFPVSPPARSTLYLLDYYKDESIKRQLVNLVAGEQYAPEYLAMNPHHSVPVLEDKANGVVLYESTAILQFLATELKFEGKYGLPQDAKKWNVINALHKHHNFCGAATNKIMGPLLALVFAKVPVDMDAFKQTVEGSKPTWALLDAQLEKNGGFVAGSTPTIADLRVWSDLFQLSNLGGEFTSAIVDFSEYKNVQQWLLDIKADLFDEAKWPALVMFYDMIRAGTGSDAFRLALH